MAGLSFYGSHFMQEYSQLRREALRHGSNLYPGKMGTLEIVQRNLS